MDKEGLEAQIGEIRKDIADVKTRYHKEGGGLTNGKEPKHLEDLTHIMRAQRKELNVLLWKRERLLSDESGMG